MRPENRKKTLVQARLTTLYCSLICCALFLVGACPAGAQSPTPDRSLDVAVVEALLDHQRNSGSPFYYVEVGRTFDADGAVLYLTLHDLHTRDVVPGIVDWGVALREAGQWRIALPGDPAYTTMFERLSPDVRARIDDSEYRAEADPVIAAALTLDDYQFPWEDGRWATVTRSFDRHGTGKIDFDLSGRAVTAAKDGIVVYANDSYNRNTYASGAWWYWNTIVIEHGPHEYSLYGHLEPGSIVPRIKERCGSDLSRANCFVPVEAGEVIALEGNTGYSQNYHLHFETGQRYGIAAYVDVHDGDGDGDRRDLVYGAYIYAEHNVAFTGYTPEQVAGWPWGTLRQALHRPSPRPNVNLVRNGDFSDGVNEWTPSGQLNWEVRDGVMRALRLRTTEPPEWAAFYQDLEVGAPAGFPLDIEFELGNASAIAKSVTVTLMNAAGRHYGQVQCRFELPPDTPLRPYRIEATTPDTWARLRLEFAFNPPDGSPAALVDNVVVMHRPRPAVATMCHGPDSPA